MEGDVLTVKANQAASSTRISAEISCYIERIAPAQRPKYRIGERDQR